MVDADGDNRITAAEFLSAAQACMQQEQQAVAVAGSNQTDNHAASIMSSISNTLITNRSMARQLFEKKAPNQHSTYAYSSQSSSTDTVRLSAQQFTAFIRSLLPGALSVADIRLILAHVWKYNLSALLSQSKGMTGQRPNNGNAYAAGQLQSSSAAAVLQPAEPGMSFAEVQQAFRAVALKTPQGIHVAPFDRSNLPVNSQTTVVASLHGSNKVDCTEGVTKQLPAGSSNSQPSPASAAGGVSGAKELASMVKNVGHGLEAVAHEPWKVQLEAVR